ncbi:MAG: hypothetical protein JWQ43_2731 [Glaciihabitans sp.]|nr:hypothetical protein [Glaciihabitans sp.]
MSQSAAARSHNTARSDRPDLVLALRCLSFAVLALGVSVLLVGCAPSTSTSTGSSSQPAGSTTAGPLVIPTPSVTPTPLATPAADYSCGMGITSQTIELGSTIQIAREAAEPCFGILPGSSQRFWTPSQKGYAIYLGEVDVADDGSFALAVDIPDGLPLGPSGIQPEPTPEFPCNDTGFAVNDCVVPYIDVRFVLPADQTAPLEIVATDVPTPPLPGNDRFAYATPGPVAGQLNITMFGDGCFVGPALWITAADATTLEVVSSAADPTASPGASPADGPCTQVWRPWTTTILVPDGFDSVQSVRVDNRDAMLVSGDPGNAGDTADDGNAGGFGLIED